EVRGERNQGLRVGQHLAPARGRRLRAQTDIGERRLGEDAEGELDGDLHHQRVEDIGQDVLERDADGALAGDAGGENEVAGPEAERGGAGEARKDRDVEDV